MHVTIAILVIAVCVALALLEVWAAGRISSRTYNEGDTSREAMKRVRKELRARLKS